MTEQARRREDEFVSRTSFSVMMLGCCPYLSRISTSSVGSRFDLLIIWSRRRGKTSLIRSSRITHPQSLPGFISVLLPWQRTPFRCLCVRSVYRWSRSRRQCPLWCRRRLRTATYCGEVAVGNAHKYMLDYSVFGLCIKPTSVGGNTELNGKIFWPRNWVNSFVNLHVQGTAITLVITRGNKNNVCFTNPLSSTFI